MRDFKAKRGEGHVEQQPESEGVFEGGHARAPVFRMGTAKFAKNFTGAAQ